MMLMGVRGTGLPCRSNRQVRSQAPTRFAGRRLQTVVAATGEPNNRPNSRGPNDQGKPDNGPTGIPFHSPASHQLPWEGYISNIFNAIEAEAKANAAFKDAYGDSFQANSKPLEGSSSTGDGSSQPAKPLGEEVKSKLQKAMETQDDARRFIWAAEYKANEFFQQVKEMKSNSSSPAGTGYSNTARSQPADSQLEEMRTAAKQGAELAKEQWLLAMQMAQALLLKSKAALTDAAINLKSALSPLLEMPIQQVVAPQQQDTGASLRQLRQLRNETMKDAAAYLARCFQRGMYEHQFHTEEAREWLEHLWHMEPEDISVYDRPGYNLPHTPSMQKQHKDTWMLVVGLVAAFSVWPSLAHW